MLMLMLVIESEVRNQRSEVRRQSSVARFPISGIKSNSRLGRRTWEGWRIVTAETKKEELRSKKEELRKAEVKIKNGATGRSDIEGKAVRVTASECGQRARFN